MSLTTEIAAALEAQFDWLYRSSVAPAGEDGNLFLLDLPDTPDAAVGLFQYPGRPPMQTLGNSNPVQLPRLQVLVRDPDINTAFQRSVDIEKYLITINGQTLSGVYYIKITCESEPSPIGPDSAKRYRFIANYEAQKNWSPDA